MYTYIYMDMIYTQIQNRRRRTTMTAESSINVTCTFEPVTCVGFSLRGASQIILYYTHLRCLHNNLIRNTMHVMYCIRIVVSENVKKTISASNQQPRVHDSIAQRSFTDQIVLNCLFSRLVLRHVNTDSAVRSFAGAPGILEPPGSFVRLIT